MTEAETEPATGFVPETWERGRYRVLTTPDGGLLINRTADLCENCQACGCGEVRDPIGPVPGVFVQAMMSGESFNPIALMRMVSQARNGGGNGRRAGRAAKRR